MGNEYIPTRERFEKSARSWYLWYTFWLYAHYVVGLIIVILTAFIATRLLTDTQTSIVGGLTSVLAATMTFLGPRSKAAIFRTRWHILNKALLDPANTKLSSIYDAYIEAESLTTESIVNLGTLDGQVDH